MNGGASCGPDLSEGNDGNRDKRYAVSTTARAIARSRVALTARALVMCKVRLGFWIPGLTESRGGRANLIS